MRPSRDEWAMQLAVETAKRSTCCRRQVGCILLNARGHVLATGYNGVAAGQLHCNHHDPFHSEGLPYACEGAHSPSGTDLDNCQAIHAEQNALLQCSDVYMIHTAYVTTAPCITCVKLLLNTSCQHIIFADDYPHPQAGKMWKAAGRTWSRMSELN